MVEAGRSPEELQVLQVAGTEIPSERDHSGALLISFIWLLLDKLESCLHSSCWPRERLARSFRAE